MTRHTSINSRPRSSQADAGHGSRRYPALDGQRGITLQLLWVHRSRANMGKEMMCEAEATCKANYQVLLHRYLTSRVRVSWWQLLCASPCCLLANPRRHFKFHSEEAGVCPGVVDEIIKSLTAWALLLARLGLPYPVIFIAILVISSPSALKFATQRWCCP
jgi:hypothetical protein